MCTSAEDGSIIIISDDDDEERGEDRNRDRSRDESSLIVMETEDVAPKEHTLSSSMLDEDLVVTFSRPAELLPHARFDCPKHPFTPTDERAKPVSGNQLVCDQCFCYICDKLAGECERWQVSGACHCNGHKKSDLWTWLRNEMLLGHLAAFKVTLSEVDAHLRQAESVLRSFKAELRAQMASSMADKRPGDGASYDCSPAYRYASDFLDKAERRGGRAAAVMRLAAAQEFMRLFYAEGVCCPVLQSSHASASKWLFMRRLLCALQRQMIMDDFTPEFRQKLQDFYRNLHFPPELKHIRSSLDVRPWEDILLVSVLKGQNVNGVRTVKGKKDTLFEETAVVLLRVQRLLDQNRFRELSRYLQVVRTHRDSRLSPLKDLVPLLMCMGGDFPAALAAFFHVVNKAAWRLTPRDILTSLRVMNTATAPKLSLGPARDLRFADDWCAIPGVAPLDRVQLVRFALRLHKGCPAVHMNSPFWASLLEMVHVNPHAPAGLPEPSPAFLQEAVHTVSSSLEKSRDNPRIPPHFVSAFPDQAMLLLVTGVLSDIILSPSLSPIIPLLCTFQKNVWALHWFWRDLLASGAGYRTAIVNKIYQELVSSAANDRQGRNRSGGQVMWPASENWDRHLQLKDFLPFLLCLEGQWDGALRMFFPEEGVAVRATPHTFPIYLRLLGTAEAPALSVAGTGELCSRDGAWSRIRGAVPLVRPKLVGFALKVLQAYPVCYSSCQCWISLLNVVNLTDSLDSIPEPSPDFKRDAVQFADSVLRSLSEGLISEPEVPRHFLQYSDQAMLLLVTKALRHIVLHPALAPVIPILYTFEKSLWALRWFWEYLSDDGRHAAIMDAIRRELRRAGNAASLRSIRHLLRPSGDPCQPEVV